MMNENLNNNEEMEIKDESMEIIELEPSDDESKSSGGLKVAVGLVAGAAALGGVGYKAIKSKKNDKPKKKKKFHIGWIDVEDEDAEIYDEDVEIIDCDDEDDEE